MEKDFKIDIIDDAISALIDLSELGICQSEISKLLERLNLEKAKLEDQ
jgi:hypothetical protein